MPKDPAHLAALVTGHRAAQGRATREQALAALAVGQ
jgi:hypothetical protein